MARIGYINVMIFQGVSQMLVSSIRSSV